MQICLGRFKSFLSIEILTNFLKDGLEAVTYLSSLLGNPFNGIVGSWGGRESSQDFKDDRKTPPSEIWS